MSKEQKISKFFIICMFLTMLVVLIIGCLLPGKDKVKLGMHKPLTFTEGWVNMNSGEKIMDNTINIAEKGSLVLAHAIPNTASNGIYICIWNSNLHITASIDGEVISDVGKNVTPAFASENGAIWQLIPLNAKDRGKMLTLTLQNTGRVRPFNLNAIYYGPYNDIQFQLIRNNTSYLFETLFIIIVGVSLLVYSLTLKRYKLMDYYHSLFYLSLMAINAGIWFFCNSAMMQFFSSNPTIRYLLSYFSLYSIPVFMMLFFIENPENKQRFLRRIVTVYSIWVTVAVLLYALNIMPLSVSVTSVHLFVILCIFLIIIICIRNYSQTHNSYILWTLMSFLFLTIGALLSLSKFYTKTSVDNAYHFRIAFLLFLLILILTNIRESVKEFSDTKAVLHYKQLAYIDPVTKGNTRYFFIEKIKEYPTVNHYFVHMNILQFRIINQVLGRAQCDDLLFDIYHYFERTLSDQETMCNLGNASLGLYLEGSTESAMHDRCRTLSEMIRYCTRKRGIRIIINLQYYIAPASQLSKEPNLDELQDCALMAKGNPLALYWSDVDCYVYNDACRRQLLRNKDLEDKLDSAIRNHYLTVYLQPKISLETQTVHGAEALARWIDPEIGMISPAEFIPVFEQNGMISKIDLFIFEEVCNIINSWIRMGQTPPIVSVNISKSAILQDNFFEKYQEIALRTHVPAKYLEFELTESTAYENFDLMRKILDDIHSMGATCSMDDFGKSYSNFSALASLKFNVVKMDKCFFDDGFPNDNRKFQLVAGTLKLLQNLGLEIVAEGIENAEQANELQKLGCNCIQGFYYARPMPVPEFGKYLSEHS